MKSNLKAKKDLISNKGESMSEWFYLQKWRQSSQEVWAVVDELGNVYNLDCFCNKYKAHAIASDLKKQNIEKKYHVVHTESLEYQDLKNRTGGENYDYNRNE